MNQFDLAIGNSLTCNSNKRVSSLAATIMWDKQATFDKILNSKSSQAFKWPNGALLLSVHVLKGDHILLLRTKPALASTKFVRMVVEPDTVPNLAPCPLSFLRSGGPLCPASTTGIKIDSNIIMGHASYIDQNGEENIFYAMQNLKQLSHVKYRTSQVASAGQILNLDQKVHKLADWRYKHQYEPLFSLSAAPHGHQGAVIFWVDAKGLQKYQWDGTITKARYRNGKFIEKLNSWGGTASAYLNLFSVAVSPDMLTAYVAEKSTTKIETIDLSKDIGCNNGWLTAELDAWPRSKSLERYGTQMTTDYHIQTVDQVRWRFQAIRKVLHQEHDKLVVTKNALCYKEQRPGSKERCCVAKALCPTSCAVMTTKTVRCGVCNATQTPIMKATLKGW